MRDSSTDYVGAETDVMEAWKDKENELYVRKADFLAGDGAEVNDGAL